MKKYVAEAIGTFCLVFAGTGAIVINDISGGQVSHVGIALTFGLVVMADDLRGRRHVGRQHLNPAVTLGFWFAQATAGHREIAPYVASQIVGARGQYFHAVAVRASDAGGHAIRRFRRANIRARRRAHGHAHVRDPRSRNRPEGKRAIGRCGNRRRHRLRSTLRRTDLRRIDEPRTVTRPSPGERLTRRRLDLHRRAYSRGRWRTVPSIHKLRRPVSVGARCATHTATLLSLPPPFSAQFMHPLKAWWKPRHLGRQRRRQKGSAMLPRTVSCEDCGETAFVRAYGRVEYDWCPDEPGSGQIATKPRIKLIRLTVDCPKCGVKTQDLHTDSDFDLSFDSSRERRERQRARANQVGMTGVAPVRRCGHWCEPASHPIRADLRNQFPPRSETAWMSVRLRGGQSRP